MHRVAASLPLVGFLASIVAALVLAVGAGGAAAAKRARPDLRVSSVAVPIAPVAPGAAFTVSVKISNAGRARANASRTALYLSSDAKKSANDVRVGAASIAALKPGKSKRRGRADGERPRA